MNTDEMVTNFLNHPAAEPIFNFEEAFRLGQAAKESAMYHKAMYLHEKETLKKYVKRATSGYLQLGNFKQIDQDFIRKRGLVMTEKLKFEDITAEELSRQRQFFINFFNFFQEYRSA